MERGASLWVPCLLHVYWFLHVVHLALGVLALKAWGKRLKEEQGARGKEQGASHQTPVTSPPATGLRLPLPFQIRHLKSSGAWGYPSLDSTRDPEPVEGLLATLYQSIPWLCLALLFYIPGIYLEWPSDPWEHLRRINEWHILDHVTDHSSWKKSSYFLPYSLTGHVTGLTQLSWLNFYYTGVCLLLSWQYYRLARAVGLGERASFIFVLLNAVTFGNNIFSFYRYYGLSSSIFAQLGAVALTRIVLEALGGAKAAQGARGKEQAAESSEQVLRSKRQESDPQSAAGCQLPVAGHRLPRRRPDGEGGLPATSRWQILSLSKGYSLLATHYPLLRSTTGGLILLLLIAFNHIQGLGIAGLGVLAVVVWRLIEWKRSMIAWLALAAVVLSVATVLWFPRHHALDEVYRPQGWLTAWYGFNLFSPASPAYERTLQILGLVGALSLPLGLWLIVSKNHIAGWLTLMPILALALPCFALPFAHVVVASTALEYIIIFHRMLLAVPLGLALVACVQCADAMTTRPQAYGIAGLYPLLAIRHSLLCACLAGAVLLSTGSPAFNRFWHGLQTTPDDLRLSHFVKIWKRSHLAMQREANALTITSTLGTQVREACSPSFRWHSFRQIPALFEQSDFAHQLDDLHSLKSALNRLGADSRAPQSDSPPDCVLIALPRQRTQEVEPVMRFTAREALWHTVAGDAPELLPATNGKVVIGSPLGRATHFFYSELIPVARDKRHLLSCTIRQTGAPDATSYLAVAWYDRNGRLLKSNRPSPDGAGSPAGWVNGIYSYYGLSNSPAPSSWTQYTITFGWGEGASIPLNAAFMRPGALLNYQSTPQAIIQIDEMTLRERDNYSACLVALPNPRKLYSHASLAGVLSAHWAGQHVADAHLGLSELRSAVPVHAQ